MDSSEWRYDVSGTDAAGQPPGADPRTVDPRDPAPDLWVDDPSNAWGATVSWPVPPPATRTSQGGFDPQAWFGPPVPTPPPPAAPMLPGAGPVPLAPTSPAPFGQPPLAPNSTPASFSPLATSPAMPSVGAAPPGMMAAGSVSAMGNPSGTSFATMFGNPVDATPGVPFGTGLEPEFGATVPAPSAEVAPWQPRHSAGPTATGGYGSRTDFAATTGSQTAVTDIARRWRRDEVYHEMVSGPLLRFTALWYGLPAIPYLLWLVTLSGDRQALAGRGFLLSLPWLLAALALSVGVAAALRRVVIGWRALTLSFASAVIGAGFTTIAYSVVL